MSEQQGTATETPRTSVIIPCHNCESTLPMQLEALALQEDAVPFEVVVVSNCSTDQTAEVALEWQDRLNVRVVIADEMANVSYARNCGIRAGVGEKLIFCDGDDLVGRHFVSYGQRALDRVPIYAAGFVGVDDSVFQLGRSAVLTLLNEGAPYESPSTARQDPRWPILPGCCFGVRTEFIKLLSGFDCSATPGAEDNDLAVRSVEAGVLPPILSCTTLAYRIMPPGDRSYMAFFLRARSTALLLTRANLWAGAPPTTGRNPVLLVMKTAASSVRLLRARDAMAYRWWRLRLAQSAGLADGYIRYRFLRKDPGRRLGVGLAAAPGSVNQGLPPDLLQGPDPAQRAE